jgi:hypothetical protein
MNSDVTDVAKFVFMAIPLVVNVGIPRPVRAESARERPAQKDCRF